MAATLKLTVVSYAGEPRPGLSRRFGAARTTVGRGTASDWVLPDPEKHLSNRHCIIDQRDNRFVITDVSKNGVFLNNTDTPLGNDNISFLAHGDLITIGDYQLLAEIEGVAPPAATAAAEPEPLDPFGSNAGFGAAESPFGLRSNPLPPLESRPPEPLMPSDIAAFDRRRDEFPLAGAASPFADPPEPRRTGRPDPNHVPAIGTFFRAPEVQAPIIPPDWNPLAPEPEPVAPPVEDSGFAPPHPDPRPAPPVPAPSPAPVAPPRAAGVADNPVAPAGGAAELLRAFLEGAGLAGAAPGTGDPAARMREYGAIFRELVAGMRELLAVRTLTKSEFRIDQTMIRPSDNNPLKFSVDLDQALAALLLPHGSGYAEPLPATREAIADLKSHEISVIAGMQRSMANLLAALSPAEVERRIEAAGLLASLLPAARKARYWEAYGTIYQQIAEEFREDAQSRFRRSFADAYFDQAKKL